MNNETLESIKMEAADQNRDSEEKLNARFEEIFKEKLGKLRDALVSYKVDWVTYECLSGRSVPAIRLDFGNNLRRITYDVISKTFAVGTIFKTEYPTIEQAIVAAERRWCIFW